LKGEGGHEFFLKKILHLKRGGGMGLLFTIFFVIFYYLYSFVTFLTPKGGRVAWDLFFSLFVIFCIVFQAFVTVFYSCNGKGV
jgi:hypothetical protein